MTPEQIVNAAADLLRQANSFTPHFAHTVREIYRGVEKDLGTGEITLRMRRRPDGVWEMPE